MPSSTPLSWRRRARPVLGTRVEVAILAGDESAFVHASELAFARLHHFHDRMSLHEPGSDLRAIADAAAGSSVPVSAETWDVIAAALAFEAESGGVFDVTVDGSAARASLRLDAAHRVHVMRRVCIDLGGIAKGAAVDAALAAIRATGAAAAVVNAGGDIATYGAEAQPITVRGPNGVSVAAGALSEGAIATSGPFDKNSASSLVLSTGRRAAWADRSVSVLAPSCQTADALTKVLAALGHAAAPLLAAHGASGFSIDAQGRLERVA